MVSIIIPTYKRSNTLERAIESCIKQTYTNIEIIVVDDNEPNSEYRNITENIMKKYEKMDNVIYIKHSQNLKGSAARNTGIRNANGNYITFLDDDDILYDEKISKQVKVLEKGQFDVVCCGVELINESNNKKMGKIIPNAEGNQHCNMLKFNLRIGTGSNPMFTRNIIERTGYFDEEFIRRQDIEYMLRILRTGKMCVIPEVLVSKYQSGHPNRPNIEKFEEVHKMWLEKYKVDIEKYSLEEQKEIYRNNYHQLCIIAVDERNWKKMYKYYKDAKEYKKYTIKMKLGIIKHIINSNY